MAKPGIFKDAALQDRVADFSYQNETRAQMIVYAGTDSKGQSLLETAKLLMACTPNGIQRGCVSV
jgi:hypothetical protein